MYYVVVRSLTDLVEEALGALDENPRLITVRAGDSLDAALQSFGDDWGVETLTPLPAEGVPEEESVVAVVAENERFFFFG